ncbi:MAG: ATP synthase F1 subunit epsilon [Ignavibacteriae bacterium HGW-Ignavibacteriae-1]|jgi:F-type H+-transporting ATPase subunit epsilon|nr:MAG: ATP synthase F1 subunit epsilon [Ignavibacteriae bacterium HGW-Ignavibacteriae-1]
MADNFLNIEIITPLKTVFSGLAKSVNVPGSKSPFTVLINHAPIVSSLDIGIIKIMTDENMELIYATDTGFIEVHDNKVSIVVESADESNEINSDKVIKTIEKLQTDLELTTDAFTQTKFKNLIKLNEIKLKVCTTANN